MKYIKFILLILFLCTFSLNAETFEASSCSQADITTAIGLASAGDTITVPAGECTWTSKLSITKGINVIGAGIDETIITNDVPTSAGSYGFPAVSINVDGETPWRFSGFTFTGPTGANWDYLGNTHIQGSVEGWRLDHVKFYNVANRVGIIRTDGSKGLIDNIQVISDTSESMGAFYIEPYYPETLWDTPTTLGGEDAIYIEDSIFSNSDTSSGGTAMDGEYGAKVVFRHNTVTNMSILVHGYEADRSAQRFEVYENTIIGAEDYDRECVTWRGGSGIAFNNTISGAWWKVFQLKDYCICKDECGSTPCQHADCDAYPCIDQIGRMYDDGANPQFHEPINFWGNTYNESTFNTPWVYDFETSGGCGPVDLDAPDIIQTDRDFYVQDDSFDGTSGVGVGTLANIPATCTVGVSYWATDSEVLYKCTSTDTFESYFTPYTYPHPLRGEVTCLGDANLSGTITIADVVAVLKHIAGTSVLEGSGFANANANGNGGIDGDDVTRILQHITGANPLAGCE